MSSQPEPPVPPPEKPRVLLVEDNEAASTGLSKLLQAHGFAVETARDGRSAITILESGTPPDILLTDMQLPDLDGRELALLARRLVPPPLTALITGWDVDSSVGEPSDWGIDWVFAKPVNVQDLVATLRSGRDRAAARPLPRRPESPSA